LGKHELVTSIQQSRWETGQESWQALSCDDRSCPASLRAPPDWGIPESVNEEVVELPVSFGY
jgi:hypothetical protein